MKNLISKIFLGLLKRYGHEYIENFSQDNFNLDLYNGKLVMNNINVKKDALCKLGIPLIIENGHIKEISLDFPLTNLSEQPCKINIKGILLKLIFDMSDPIYRLSELEKILTPDPPKNTKKSGKKNLIKSIIERIINNLIVQIKNIKVSIKFTLKNRIITPGFLIEEISLKTMNEEWNEEIFFKEGEDSSRKIGINKLLRVDEFILFYAKEFQKNSFNLAFKNYKFDTASSSLFRENIKKSKITEFSLEIRIEMNLHTYKASIIPNNIYLLMPNLQFNATPEIIDDINKILKTEEELSPQSNFKLIVGKVIKNIRKRDFQYIYRQRNYKENKRFLQIIKKEPKEQIKFWIKEVNDLNSGNIISKISNFFKSSNSDPFNSPEEKEALNSFIVNNNGILDGWQLHSSVNEIIISYGPHIIKLNEIKSIAKSFPGEDQIKIEINSISTISPFGAFLTSTTTNNSYPFFQANFQSSNQKRLYLCFDHLNLKVSKELVKLIQKIHKVISSENKNTTIPNNSLEETEKSEKIDLFFVIKEYHMKLLNFDIEFQELECALGNDNIDGRLTSMKINEIVKEFSLNFSVSLKTTPIKVNAKADEIFLNLQLETIKNILDDYVKNDNWTNENIEEERFNRTKSQTISYEREAPKGKTIIGKKSIFASPIRNSSTLGNRTRKRTITIEQDEKQKPKISKFKTMNLEEQISKNETIELIESKKAENLTFAISFSFEVSNIKIHYVNRNLNLNGSKLKITYLKRIQLFINELNLAFESGIDVLKVKDLEFAFNSFKNYEKTLTVLDLSISKIWNFWKFDDLKGIFDDIISVNNYVNSLTDASNSSVQSSKSDLSFALHIKNFEMLMGRKNYLATLGNISHLNFFMNSEQMKIDIREINLFDTSYINKNFNRKNPFIDKSLESLMNFKGIKTIFSKSKTIEVEYVYIVYYQQKILRIVDFITTDILDLIMSLDSKKENIDIQSDRQVSDQSEYKVKFDDKIDISIIVKDTNIDIYPCQWLLSGFNIPSFKVAVDYYENSKIQISVDPCKIMRKNLQIEEENIIISEGFSLLLTKEASIIKLNLNLSELFLSSADYQILMKVLFNNILFDDFLDYVPNQIIESSVLDLKINIPFINLKLVEGSFPSNEELKMSSCNSNIEYDSTWINISIEDLIIALERDLKGAMQVNIESKRILGEMYKEGFEIYSLEESEKEKALSFSFNNIERKIDIKIQKLFGDMTIQSYSKLGLFFPLDDDTEILIPMIKEPLPLYVFISIKDLRAELPIGELKPVFGFVGRLSLSFSKGVPNELHASDHSCDDNSGNEMKLSLINFKILHCPSNKAIFEPEDPFIHMLTYSCSNVNKSANSIKIRIGKIKSTLSFKDVYILKSSFKEAEDELSESFRNLSENKNEKEENLVDVNFDHTFSLALDLELLELVLIDDVGPFCVPVLHLAAIINPYQSITKGFNSTLLDLQISLNIYSNKSGRLEPIVERTNLIYKAQEIEHSIEKNIEIPSYINVNLSDEILKTALDASESWGKLEESKEVDKDHNFQSYVSHFTIKNYSAYIIKISPMQKNKSCEELEIPPGSSGLLSLDDDDLIENRIKRITKLRLKVYDDYSNEYIFNGLEIGRIRTKYLKISSEDSLNSQIKLISDARLIDLHVYPELQIENNSDYDLDFTCCASGKPQWISKLPEKKTIGVPSGFIESSNCQISISLSVGKDSLKATPDEIESLVQTRKRINRKVENAATEENNLISTKKHNFLYLTEIENVSLIHHDSYTSCLIMENLNLRKKLKIEAPYQFYNYLPVNVTIYFDDNESVAFNVATQKTLYYPFFEESGVVVIKMKVDGYEISEKISLNLENTEYPIQLIDELENIVTKIYIVKSQEKLPAKYFFYSQGFVVNETDENIILFEEKKEVNYKLGGQRKNNRIMALLNIEQNLVFGISEEYSFKVPIINVGSYLASMKCTENGMIQLKEFSVQVNLYCAVPELNLYTKLVEITPKTVILNNTKKVLEVCQYKSNYSFRRILPGGREPIIWTDCRKEKCISVRESEEWEWSGKIDASIFTSCNFINMKKKTSQSKQFRALISPSTSGIIFISIAEPESPAYMIQNNTSNFELFVRQKDISNPQFVVLKGSSIEWAWPEPYRPNHIEINYLHNSQNISFTETYNLEDLEFKGSYKDFSEDILNETIYDVTYKMEIFGSTRTVIIEEHGVVKEPEILDIYTNSKRKRRKRDSSESEESSKQKIELEASSFKLKTLQSNQNFQSENKLSFKNNGQNSRESSSIYEKTENLKLNISKICFSLIGPNSNNNYMAHEILLATINTLLFEMEKFDDHYNLKLKIKWLNIDNNVSLDTMEPVFFSPLNWNNLNAKAESFFLKGELSMRSPTQEVIFIEDAHFKLLPFVMRISGDVLFSLYYFYNSLMERNEKARKSNKVMKMLVSKDKREIKPSSFSKRISSKISATKQFVEITEVSDKSTRFNDSMANFYWLEEEPGNFKKYFYIKNFDIQPLFMLFSLHIHHNSKQSHIPLLSALASILGSAITDIEEAQVKLPGYSIQTMFDSVNGVVRAAKEHYYQHFLRLILRLLGSIDILGAPASLFSNVSDGWAELLENPDKLTSGIPMLMQRFTTATCSSLTKMTTSFANGASFFAFDDRFTELRYEMHRIRPRHAPHGVFLGVKAIGFGIYYGVEGVIRVPCKDVRDPVDIPKNVMTSFLGLVAKPLTSMFDAASFLTGGFKNSLAPPSEYPNTKRIRYIRPFYDSENYIKPYDEIDAEIFSFVHPHLSFLGAYQISSGEILVITSLGIQIFRKKKPLNLISIKDILKIEEFPDPEDTSKQSLKAILGRDYPNIGKVFKIRYFRKADPFADKLKDSIIRAREIHQDILESMKLSPE